MNLSLHYSLDKHCEEKRGFLFEEIISFSRECLQPSVTLTRVYFGSAHPWETDAMPQTLGQRRRVLRRQRERGTLSLQTPIFPMVMARWRPMGLCCDKNLLISLPHVTRTGKVECEWWKHNCDRVTSGSFVVSLGKQCTVIEM